MPANKKYIDITPEIIEKLKRLKEETGIKPDSLLRGKKDRPRALSSVQVNGWMKGRIKSAKPRYVDYIFNLWEKEEKIPFCEEEKLQELIEDISRLGLNGQQIAHKLDKSVSNLGPKGVDNIIIGKNRNVRVNVFKAIKKSVKKIEDNLKRLEKTGKILTDIEKEKRVAFTDKEIEKLKRYRDLGVLPSRALELSPDNPYDLDQYMITGWISGATKTTFPKHKEWVFKACSKLLLGIE